MKKRSRKLRAWLRSSKYSLELCIEGARGWGKGTFNISPIVAAGPLVIITIQSEWASSYIVIIITACHGFPNIQHLLLQLASECIERPKWFIHQHILSIAILSQCPPAVSSPEISFLSCCRQVLPLLGVLQQCWFSSVMAFSVLHPLPTDILTHS